MEKCNSPAAIFGRKNFFCSSEPKCMIVGATLLIVRNGTGTFAIDASSLKMRPSIGGERSWPPYSLGQLRVSHPSVPICLTVSR